MGGAFPLGLLKRSWASFLGPDSWSELSKDLSLSLKEKSEVLFLGTLEASGTVSCKLTFSRSVGTSSILPQGGDTSAGNTLDDRLGKLWVQRAGAAGLGAEGWAVLAVGEPREKKAEALLAMSRLGDGWSLSLLELLFRKLNERVWEWGGLVGKVFDSGLAQDFLPPSELGSSGSRDLRMALAMSRSGDLGGATLRSPGARSAGAPILSWDCLWAGKVSFSAWGSSKGWTGFSTWPPVPFLVFFWGSRAPVSSCKFSRLESFQSNNQVFCSGVRTNFFKPDFSSASSNPPSSTFLGLVLPSPGFSLAQGDSKWSGKHLSFPSVGCGPLWMLLMSLGGVTASWHPSEANSAGLGDLELLRLSPLGLTRQYSVRSSTCPGRRRGRSLGGPWALARLRKMGVDGLKWPLENCEGVLKAVTWKGQAKPTVI